MLQPGVWMVFCSAALITTSITSITNWQCEFAVTPAYAAADFANIGNFGPGSNLSFSSTLGDLQMPVPTIFLNISTATTYILGVLTTFSGTATAYGSIKPVRIA
jgi:hypothetical protein